MSRYLLSSAGILLATFAFGCGKYKSEGFQVSASDGRPSPTPKPIDPRIASLTALELCSRLGEIEVIDGRAPEKSDDLYKAIIEKRAEAHPCLLEKVSDRTKTTDPRTAPKWRHYAVGDTAVFTILDIVSEGDDQRWEELMLKSLPTKYREEWETNGVYAYFNYVSEPKNRKELQSWWKNWLKENKK